MQYNCTDWGESRNSREDGRSKTYKYCQKHESPSHHDVVFFFDYNRPDVTALTVQDTVEIKSITIHAKNHDWISAQFSSAGYWTQKGPVVFPQWKPLPTSISNSTVSICSRLQLKCDDTRWHMGGEVNGKLTNGVGSQYPSHYLGTWCIQHYYQQ